MHTKTELTLEQTQQGVSDEVLISIERVEELKRNVKIKGEKKEALLTLRQKPEFNILRANPQATIFSKEHLVPHVNRLAIKKNNQRVALDSDIIDTMLRFIVGILRHHKLYKLVSLTTTVPIIYL
ncbi:hypothetical protein Tco_0990724 [Tanacetum coccineum]|uniref:Uncharacterized protein n=1 Tax=Tanacetum coccineum TaxID=301880 RepID=A0ABQ5EXK5_9ASTR